MLRVFLLTNAGLGLLCVVCELVCHFVLHYPAGWRTDQRPYTWPVLYFSHWRDFGCWFNRFQLLHTPEFFSDAPNLDEPFTYPAPAAFLFEAFYLFGRYALQVFSVVTTGAVLFAFWKFGLAVYRRGLSRAQTILLIGTAVLFSYPFWFEFGLANMEIWIWLLVAAGIWAYVSGRMYVAATLLCLAGAAKLFPLLYLGLFLARRRYAVLGYAAALLVALNVSALWMLEPNFGIALHGIHEGMSYFRGAYLINVRYLTGYDHSLLGLIKIIVWVFLHPTPTMMMKLAEGYLVVVGLIGVWIFFRRIRHLPFANQLLALTVASVLFFPTSHDYTLMHLYTPWAVLVLMVLVDREVADSKAVMGMFVLLAVAMSAETEFIRSGVTFGGQIKCIALLMLFLRSLRHPLGMEPCPEAQGS